MKPSSKPLLLVATLVCLLAIREHADAQASKLRATIAAYDLAIADPAFAKRTIGKYTRTTDIATLDETYNENVKDYALKIPLVSLAGLNSILDFRAESTAEVKKLALKEMYDNSLLLEIQRYHKIRNLHETRPVRPYAEA